MRKSFDRNEFKELVLSGLDYETIATKTGITRNSVRQRVVILKREGVIPEEFDARKRNRRHLRLPKKKNHSGKKLCNQSCCNCKNKCNEFKIVIALVENGIDLKVGRKVYSVQSKN